MGSMLIIWKYILHFYGACGWANKIRPLTAVLSEILNWHQDPDQDTK